MNPEETFLVQWRDGCTPEGVWHPYGELPTEELAIWEVDRMSDRTSWIGCRIRIMRKVSTFELVEEVSL